MEEIWRRHTESLLWKLEAAHNVVEDQIALNRRVHEATEKVLEEITRRFYPHIGNWEPGQLERLADRISRVPRDYCLELDNLDYASEQAKEA